MYQQWYTMEGIVFAVTPAFDVSAVVIGLQSEIMLVDIESLFFAITFCILGAMPFKNFLLRLHQTNSGNKQ